jgi:signal transduction histidine kinase
MPSLRRRLVVATGLLLALQATGAGLVVWSERAVRAAEAEEARLGTARTVVAGFGEAVREQYVHQAHTFIEGGARHVGHYGATEMLAMARRNEVALLGLPDAAAVESLSRAHDALCVWFREVVVPEATAGTMDRPRAEALNDEADRRASAIGADVRALVTTLDARAADARHDAEQATRRVLAAVLGLLVVSVVAGGATVRGLAHVEAVERARIRTERLAALGEMSAAVAHELLNPLTVILAQADDPAVRAEATHARRVVEGLLGFARPGREAPAPVDLAAAAADTADRLAMVADGRDVRIEVHAPSPRVVDLPPSAARHILDNLVRNAVEASPAGGVVEVEVGESVRVADRGPGLPAAVRARLYEPFATGRPDGTGLGLAVCQRVAQSLGGGLAHADRPGGGTVATWSPRA